MHEHLDVPYHQQDTDIYCGAACAQMVLRAIGQPLLTQVGSVQRQSQSHRGGHRLGVATRRVLLDDEQPAGAEAFHAGLHRYRGSDQPHHLLGDPSLSMRALSRWSTAATTGSSCAAIPRARRQLASYDTSYTISSFDLNNPWPRFPRHRVRRRTPTGMSAEAGASAASPTSTSPTARGRPII